MQRLLASLMAPLPPDQVGPCKNEWLTALHTASDLAQAVRCGQELLRQTTDRVSAGHKARRGDVSDEQNTWANALEECARGFIEQCAVLVETCSGAPPGLANRIYGCAVRLTEALGATEALLVALDNELLMMSDRFVQLEVLYNVALERIEAVSSEVPVMEKKVEESDSRALEATSAREELSLKCRDMRTALQKAEKRAAAAEHRVSESARELQAAKRDAQIAQRRADKAEKKISETESKADAAVAAAVAEASNARRAASATPRERFRKSFANLHATMSVGSTAFASTPGQSPQPDSDQIGETSTEISTWRARDFSPEFGSPVSPLELPGHALRQGRGGSNADVRLHSTPLGGMQSTYSRHSTASRVSTHSRMSAHSSASQPVSRLAHDASHKSRSASPRNPYLDRQGTPFTQIPHRLAEQELSGDDGSGCSGGMRSQATTAKSNVTSDQDSDDAEAARATPLARGSIWACTLNKANPLAASAQQSFMHLSALVREAQDRHPNLASPRGECVELDMISPAEGLQQVAGHIRRWAEAELASVDGGLAQSIGQSAMHLQTLAGLSR